MSEIEDFIVGELEQRGIDFEVGREFIEVSCIFHEHSGTKKKLGFSRTSGGMHCFVCKKGGHFNEYARLMDLKQLDLTDGQLQDYGSVLKELEQIKTREKRQPSQPDLVQPWTNEVWRGLPRSFVETLPSYLWFDETSKANRILWPIYMDDIFMGCTAARIDPRDHSVFPKTRNLTGLDSKKILFPFDYPLIQNSKTVVLVEGQFDAVRLLYHGIPALSILGTGNWDRLKLNRLAARKVKRIVLAFDGDLAGERCTDEVLRDGIEESFDTRIMVFPDPDDDERAEGISTVDPGNCKHKYLRVIQKMVQD